VNSKAPQTTYELRVLSTSDPSHDQRAAAQLKALHALLKASVNELLGEPVSSFDVA
jgi:hypothetical protein